MNAEALWALLAPDAEAALADVPITAADINAQTWKRLLDATPEQADE